VLTWSNFFHSHQFLSIRVDRRSL